METGATVHLILMIVLTPISFGAMGLVVWWFFTQQSDTTQARNVENIWSHRNVWGEDLCRRLIDGAIETGMNPEMVKLAWGAPTSTEVQSGIQERWDYYKGKQKKLIGTVTFENYRVVQFSAPRLISNRGRTVWIYIALLFGLSFVVSVITVVTIFWIGG